VSDAGSRGWTRETRETWGWAAAGALLAGCAVAIRWNNAFLYPHQYGFDAPGNWDYIELLMSSWAMPAPGEGWSTSHPPLFYYLGALVGRSLPGMGEAGVTIAIRLLSSLMGLLGIAAAVWLVRCRDPKDRPQVIIAAALLLYLPVHIYMSAMLGEEIIAAALISFVLVAAAAELSREPLQRRGLGYAVLLGMVAGLAFLTKLSGLLVIAAVAGAVGLDGLRRRAVAPALRWACAFGVVAVLVGGWPYARNKVEYGYFYPRNLMAHEIMFTMPPGERGVADYLRFPMAAFSDPQALAPDLLHSVWGTTYTTLFFDGHRVILPRGGVDVRRAGTVLLLLGLLPCLAFAVGSVRGLKRAIASPKGPDALFLLMIALTLSGYVLFTWQNPWYATLKGSYMLGIAVPFAWYASEVLAAWIRPVNRIRAVAVSACLAALVVGSALTFTVNLVFVKREGPGFVWPKVDPSRHYREAIPNAPPSREQGPDAARMLEEAGV